MTAVNERLLDTERQCLSDLDKEECNAIAVDETACMYSSTVMGPPLRRCTPVGNRLLVIRTAQYADTSHQHCSCDGERRGGAENFLSEMLYRDDGNTIASNAYYYHIEIATHMDMLLLPVQVMLRCIKRTQRNDYLMPHSLQQVYSA